MNFRRTLLSALLLTAASAGSQAHAQCGPYGGGYGGFGAWDMGRLYGVLADNVPYYAAFPPVYYSQPVPRTYGYSPFAYPPGVMTPEVVEEVQPAVIENPYFTPGTTSEAPAAEAGEPVVDQTTSVAPARGPQEILNPYFSRTENAVAAGRRPAGASTSQAF
jgi:hypothetical protein